MNDGSIVGAAAMEEFILDGSLPTMSLVPCENQRRCFFGKTFYYLYTIFGGVWYATATSY
jgi:hypothetical protein